MLESSLDEINSFALSGGYDDDSAANMRNEFEQHKRAGTPEPFPKPVDEPTRRAASDNSFESDAGKLTEKLPKRFKNDKITDAFVLSMQTGLPLVVQVGQHWCSHCQNMESNVWPAVEGTAQNKGSMEGKAVFLHLDYDKSRNLEGDDAWLAQKLRADVSGFPTYRVYKIGDTGSVQKIAESGGSMSKADLEKFLRSAGVS
ncbi:MAG: thioredoxin family protein [Candidatus Obscuribacterales bacterium]|nr:thioredoxin family protein [Candidatus Obscuribacterales bacterium]